MARAVVTKVPGSGGAVTLATCKRAAALRDPRSGRLRHARRRRRLQSACAGRATGADRVARRRGATGAPAPATLKVSLGYRDGFIGEGQISYGGAGRGGARRGWPRAIVDGAAADRSACRPTTLRCDLIGLDALHGAARSRGHPEPYEVRLRVAARTRTRGRGRSRRQRGRGALHQRPGGRRRRDRRRSREVLAIASTFVPRDRVSCRVIAGGGLTCGCVTSRTRRSRRQGPTVNIVA